MRSVLSDLGINPGKALPAPPPPAGVGGPFVPANAATEEKSFERQLYRIHLSRSQVDRLNRALLDIPVRKPVTGELDMSSGFGIRMDPFLRSPAMHTGLDMRGDTGDPVRVTANGKVSFAGNNGGYGKMVEVDHKERIVDALRASVGNRRPSWPGREDRPGRSARSARPDDRPVRICTMKHASTARQSIHRNICAQERGSDCIKPWLKSATAQINRAYRQSLTYNATFVT